MKKQKNNKKVKVSVIVATISIILVIGVALLLFLGSKKDSTLPKITKKNSSTPTIESNLKIVDLNSKTRPYAIMINNLGVARPLQSGLQDAMIIYEMIVEGGLTRYMAVFQDQNTERIGSIRSARHYFLDYVMENDAIFVHYGQSPQAKEDLASLSINNVNGMYNAKGFFRDKTLKRAWEHTAFTSIEKINTVVKSKKYRTTTEEQLLKYSPIKVDHSSDDTLKTANKVTIKYSNYQTTSYEYDKENMNYKMFMSGKSHDDLVTKKQYTVKNIITYQVKNTSLGDKKGRQDLDNVGSGEGYYISNGEAIKIKWSKSSRSSKTKYTLMNGEELVVNDGNTWIHIQPKGQTLKIE